MGKGMSLDDLKKTLSSEESIKNEKLKEQIKLFKKNSKKELDEMMEKFEDEKEINEFLKEKCLLLSLGQFCNKCSIYSCQYNKSSVDIVDVENKELLKDLDFKTKNNNDVINPYNSKSKQEQDKLDKILSGLSLFNTIDEANESVTSVIEHSNCTYDESTKTIEEDLNLDEKKHIFARIFDKFFNKK